ncbi:MAG: branched-chain amino acid ABC transporter permease [Candidatus Methanomethyliaceae archaeon]
MGKNRLGAYMRMMVMIINVIVTALVMGGIYVLIAIGLNLQYGVARVLNIAYGEFIMLGAFITWELVAKYGINPMVSLLVSGPVVSLIGYILYKTVFTRIRNTSASNEIFESNSLLAAFGLIYIIQNIAILIWGSGIRGYAFETSPLAVGGISIPTNQVIMLIFALIIGLLFYLFLTRSRLGKAIRAASCDPIAAGLMGIDMHRVLSICFALGALMAGFAGSLLSTSFAINAAMGFDYAIIGIVVIVLGGLGNIMGSFAGGFLLSLVDAIVKLIEPSLSMLAFYLLFMLVLIIKPSGILGK